MQKYSYPSWYTKYFDPATVTDQQIEDWRAETDVCVEKNKEIAKANSAETEAMLKVIESYFGNPSKVFKYIKSNLGNNYNRINSNSFEHSVIKKVREAREKLMKEAADKKKKEDEIGLAAEAIVWLQARGKVLGTDFEVSYAIETADEIAFDEEVLKQTEADNYHDFSGQNCDGPCKGWDGQDRRCECGNRRVSWTQGWGHSFKNPYIYGEAY